METLKNKKGITLTSLVVIIAVMMILAGVAIYNGQESIDLAKVTQFNTELRIIKAKVDEMAEYELTTEEQRNYGQDIAAQPAEIKEKISTALGGNTANRI